MHNFVERKMPIRDRALRAAVSKVALLMWAREGLEAVTLARIADRLAAADFAVSERTLRRRYSTPARLLFGDPWWLTDPFAAAVAVLQPRPEPAVGGAVWPTGPEAEEASAIDHVFDLDAENAELDSGIDGDESDWPAPEFFTDAGITDPLGVLRCTAPHPIALHHFLRDLHAVISGHVLTTGFAMHLPAIGRLRDDDPEVAAWLALSQHTYANRLRALLTIVFGLPGTAAFAASHAFVAVNEALNPELGSLATAIARQRAGLPGCDTREPRIALAEAREAAFAQFTGVLSVSDKIRVPPGKGTVASAPDLDTLLPYRRPHLRE